MSRAHNFDDGSSIMCIDAFLKCQDHFLTDNTKLRFNVKKFPGLILKLQLITFRSR